MKKFNWGMGIFVALSLFVVAMGYTVYLTMQNDYELVDEHYYQRELGYDVELAGLERGMAAFENIPILREEGKWTLPLTATYDSAYARLIHPERPALDRNLPCTFGTDQLEMATVRAPQLWVQWTLEIQLFDAEGLVLHRRLWNY